MTSKADLNQVGSVGYGSEEKTSWTYAKHTVSDDEEEKVSWTFAKPNISEDSSDSEDSVDSTDSTLFIELSEEKESDDDTQHTDFIPPKTLKPISKKVKSFTSDFLSPRKILKKTTEDVEEKEIDEIEVFKNHIVKSVSQSLSDSVLSKQILGTKEEPQATQDSWNKDKKETTLYPDPVPPILGEKERLPVKISEQVIKDMERPGFRLEIEEKIYENLLNKKTPQKLAEENKEYIQLFLANEKTEDPAEVFIDGKKYTVDVCKLIEFAKRKYTYETARELTEKYGENAAQFILFGFHQGHWTRDCAFTSAIKVKLLTEYDMNNIKQPLEMRNDRAIKVEVERNSSKKIRKFRFKFTSSTQFVKEGHDKPEIEAILKFQFHVSPSSKQFKVKKYSVDEFYLLSK